VVKGVEEFEIQEISQEKEKRARTGLRAVSRGLGTRKRYPLIIQMVMRSN
jgi:hypothetical protein